MTPVDFNTLAQQCAPGIHPTTLQAVVRTESGFNPFAIGVVGGRLVRQPQNREEAVATVKALDAVGWNYSMGLAQVNRSNLSRYGMDANAAFDPCANLRAGSAILADCYGRASARMGAGQDALRAAFSCYYSGNFQRGFVRDAGTASYVQRVVANVLPASSAVVTGAVQPIPVVPARTPETVLGTSSPGASDSVPAAVPGVAAVPTVTRRAPVERERAHQSWDTFGEF